MRFTLLLIAVFAIAVRARLSDSACDAKIDAFVATIPKLEDDLKSNNYFTLLADLTSIKSQYDDFSASCLDSTDATCNASLTSIENDMMDAFHSALASDRDSTKTKVSALVDEQLAWYNKCVGSQKIANGVFMMAFVSTAANYTVASFKNKKLRAGADDQCIDMVNKVVDMVPALIDDVKSMNVIKIAADYNTLDTMFKQFQATCVNKSADCTSTFNALLDQFNEALTHLHDKDATVLKSKALALVDSNFDYREKCLGPQSVAAKLRMLASGLNKF